jgi:two-component system phosphate regulon response regulator PhoB
MDNQPQSDLPQQPLLVNPDPALVAPPATPVSAAPVATPYQLPQHPKRLLLVEDDDSLANVYITRLEAEGFDIRRVANGEEALATALSYHPDLIILDVMMPKVSGFDVLDILRNTPETANLKIVMLTALSQDSDKQRAESLGVDDYLVKSQVVIADVIERIKHHLNIQ